MKSSQTVEIVIPNPLPSNETNKLLVLIEIYRYEVIKTEIFYLESVCLMR